MLRLLLFFLLSGLLPASLVVAEVAVVRDFQQEAKLAQQRRLPLLITFSTAECNYCDLLEEEFLEPMLLGHYYKDRVLIRKLELDGDDVRGFAGEWLTPSAFARIYGVRVTPTMLFLDPYGKELSERMIGIATPELFGGYLDEAIEEALAKLKQRQF